MVILALETVTRAGSLALYDQGTCHASVGDPAKTHGMRLPGELLAFAGGHGRLLADVDLLAVVTGPGSFTGLRIGLATIQGLALASGRRAVPIPTLDALTSGWMDAHPGYAGRVVACLDGARGEVFFSVYDTTDADVFERARLVLPASVATPAVAAGQVAALDGAPPLTIVGDGAHRYGGAFLAALPRAVLESSDVNLALGAVRLAVRQASTAVSPHALRPIYVRRPDVELARERQQRSRAAAAPPSDDLRMHQATSAEELDAVAALQRRSFTNAWGAEAMRWELEHTDVARLYVARTPAGEAVAYCACWIVFDELHINSLAVDEAWRRRGVASRLLRHVLRAAAAAGARGATLEVRESNEPARGLYEGLGFTVEGVRRNYYQKPSEDGLILWHRGIAGLPA